MKKIITISLIVIAATSLLGYTLAKGQPNLRKEGFCVINYTTNPQVTAGEGNNPNSGQHFLAANGGTYCGSKQDVTLNFTVQSQGTGGNCFYFNNIVIKSTMRGPQGQAPYVEIHAYTGGAPQPLFRYWNGANQVTTELYPSQVSNYAGSCGQ